MKRKILFYTIVLFLGTGSYASAQMKGDGNIVTREVHIGEFSRIKIGAGIECNNRFFSKKSYENPVFHYTQARGGVSLSVTIDENLFSLLEINVSGGELSVGVKKGNKINPSRMSITGSSGELQSVSVSGCVDFMVRDAFASDRLEIKVSGASDVKINDWSQIDQLSIRISGAGDFVADNLLCKDIDSHVSGAGDITLRGSADRGKFTVTGAGDIRAFDFVVKDLTCRVSGAGDIKVTATETLEASVSGTGDIHYRGNARANTKVSGFGDIKKVK